VARLGGVAQAAALTSSTHILTARPISTSSVTRVVSARLGRAVHRNVTLDRLVFILLAARRATVLLRLDGIRSVYQARHIRPLLPRMHVFTQCK